MHPLLEKLRKEGYVIIKAKKYYNSTIYHIRDKNYRLKYIITVIG